VTVVSNVAIALACLASVAEARPHPAIGGIGYTCAHSDMPFSDGHEESRIAIDFAAATRTEDSTVVPPGDAKRLPNTPSKTTHTHDVTKLDAVRLQRLRVAANAVADGGPFKPEYPVPEGTSCTLQLTDVHGASFVQIEKSNPHIDDAATRLVKLL
jgi:hypothetical protein